MIIFNWWSDKWNRKRIFLWKIKEERKEVSGKDELCRKYKIKWYKFKYFNNYNEFNRIKFI